MPKLKPAPRDTVELYALLSQIYLHWRENGFYDSFSQEDFGPYLCRRLAEHGVQMMPDHFNIFSNNPYYTEP